MVYAPFSGLEMAPPDPILGLADQFRKETNPNKINLGVGVYLDDRGVNPVLATVKKAERALLEQETTKDYLGIGGNARYGELTRRLMFGAGHPLLAQGRAETLQAPGGTGALRLGADFLKSRFPGATIYISDPTWPNHRAIFANAGLTVKTYPWYDPASNTLRFAEILAAIKTMAQGDVMVLHACCHNPTGIDPTTTQWDEIIALLGQQGVIAFVDFAYQGFGTGVDEDAYSVRALASSGQSFLVANSYSKSFGLYRERVGALTVVASNAPEAERVLSQVKLAARSNYSNPPAHGGLVVETILADAALQQEWLQELTTMRQRILGMRRLFVQTLKAKGVQRDFSFLERQAGMFSFSGISKDDVLKLRAQYGIYLVENGRINVAGMTPSNMDYLCQAIADVLK